MKNDIIWDDDTASGGTALRGYLDNTPYPFEELVARLITLSNQNPTRHTDGYKVSVEFIGTFRGDVFTLYDYKGDIEIHIGGTDRLDVAKLKLALLEMLKDAEPSSYTATLHYDDLDGQKHGYPIVSDGRGEIVIWDWKDQPDWSSINQHIANGLTHITPVDTGGDDYAIVMSSEHMTAEQAQQVYSDIMETGG